KLFLSFDQPTKPLVYLHPVRNRLEVDLAWCEIIANSNLVPPRTSLRAAALLDAAQSSLVSKTKMSPPYASCDWFTVVSGPTLRCFHRRMLQVATCDQIATVKSNIA